eukprot:gene24684-10314_t
MLKSVRANNHPRGGYRNAAIPAAYGGHGDEGQHHSYAAHWFWKDSDSRRVFTKAWSSSVTLFLVPTCLLVEQQSRAIREWSKLRVAELVGGQRVNTAFDILVATPKAFEAAQRRGDPALAWSRFQLLVFDEVHHTLKDHPYRTLAAGLRSSGAQPRVLGLSASLTYAVGKAKVTSALQELCDELMIEHMESASHEELRESGYHGSAIATEVRTLEHVPASWVEGVLPAAQRKPHLMLQSFFSRVHKRESTALSSALVECVYSMEKAAMAVYPSFKSPLQRKSVREWGQYAHGQKPGLVRQLEPWYEALRLMVVSWEEAEEAVVEFLRMTNADKQTDSWPASVKAKLNVFWEEALRDKLDNSPNAFHGIVFVEQRVMTHVVVHVIKSDPDLAARLRPRGIYATASPATASLNISARQVQDHIQEFSNGTCNLMVATATAEEGLDIASANCVIRFDPLVHSGRGRARQAESSHVVLAQRADRPVKLLEQTEAEQLAHVRDFVPVQGAVRDEILRTKQVAWEIGARGVPGKGGATPLVAREHGARGVLGKSGAMPLATLNLYVSKTKALLTEGASPLVSSSATHVELKYSSILRTLVGRGQGRSMKEAKQAAALELLGKLKTSA